MFCQNCGEKLKDDSKFCSKCGERIGNAETNVKTIKGDAKADNNKKIIIALALVAIILAAIALSFILNGSVQPEIIVPDGFALESNQSGILTYAGAEDAYNKIDIQKSSIPSKDYPNENVAVLKTMVNNTEYTITIHGRDYHDSYMQNMGSIAQKKLMYAYFEEMIDNGHLDSSLDDVQCYGDFEGYEVYY